MILILPIVYFFGLCAAAVIAGALKPSGGYKVKGDDTAVFWMVVLWPLTAAVFLVVGCPVLLFDWAYTTALRYRNRRLTAKEDAATYRSLD